MAEWLYSELRTTHPTWYVALLRDSDPWFDLCPVACWAIKDTGSEQRIVPLIASDIRGELVEAKPDLFMGLYHAEQIMPTLREHLGKEGLRRATVNWGFEV